MSDITTQQFDREDFFPFVRPWSISILSLYVIYTAIVVPLFIWRSNFHPLKLRSKGYMFVMIFAQLLMVGILSLRIAIGRQIFPCVLYYIFAFFGVPSLKKKINNFSVYVSIYHAVFSINHGHKIRKNETRNGQL
jgi:uncharacterized protein YacL